MADVSPRLIVFSDTTRAVVPTLLQRYATLAERARPGSIQFTLRDYSLALRERWALAVRLAELTGRTGHVFAAAERADLARAFGCRAFHLPDGGLSADDARSYLGDQVVISRGCHDLPSEVEPELDALLLSPIFEARKGRPALGLAALGAACAALPRVRWYALGGADAGNAASCLAAGAAGVAVIGAALEADPEPLLSALGILG